MITVTIGKDGGGGGEARTPRSNTVCFLFYGCIDRIAFVLYSILFELIIVILITIIPCCQHEHESERGVRMGNVHCLHCSGRLCWLSAV